MSILSLSLDCPLEGTLFDEMTQFVTTSELVVEFIQYIQNAD